MRSLPTRRPVIRTTGWTDAVVALTPCQGHCSVEQHAPWCVPRRRAPTAQHACTQALSTASGRANIPSRDVPTRLERAATCRRHRSAHQWTAARSPVVPRVSRAIRRQGNGLRSLTVIFLQRLSGMSTALLGHAAGVTDLRVSEKSVAPRRDLAQGRRDSAARSISHWQPWHRRDGRRDDGPGMGARVDFLRTRCHDTSPTTPPGDRSATRPAAAPSRRDGPPALSLLPAWR